MKAFGFHCNGQRGRQGPVEPLWHAPSPETAKVVAKLRPRSAVVCHGVRGWASCDLVNELVHGELVPFEAHPRIFELQQDDSFTPADASAVFHVGFAEPWDALRVEAGREQLGFEQHALVLGGFWDEDPPALKYDKSPPSPAGLFDTNEARYPFDRTDAFTSWYARDSGREFTYAFNQAWDSMKYDCMCKKMTQEQLMLSPLWGVTMHFLGYLAWTYERVVHEGMHIHARAVACAQVCSKIDTGTQWDDRIARVLRSVRHFVIEQERMQEKREKSCARISIRYSIDLGKVTTDATHKGSAHVRLAGVPPEKAVADIAVAWNWRLDFTQFVMKVEPFGTLNIGGGVHTHTCSGDDSHHTFDVHAQYKRLLEKDFSQDAVKACRQDVESILKSSVGRLKTAQKHSQGASEFLHALRNELRHASTLYEGLSQAIAGRVPVCVITDGCLCIFLLPQRQKKPNRKRVEEWGFKYYVCFTCWKEDGRPTAYQALHYLLKGPLNARLMHKDDSFAEIANARFLSNDQMEKERRRLRFSTYSELTNLLRQIEGCDAPQIATAAAAAAAAPPQLTPA